MFFAKLRFLFRIAKKKEQKVLMLLANVLSYLKESVSNFISTCGEMRS